jgi:hypothetical protein
MEDRLGEDDHLALRAYGLLQTSVVRDLKLTPLVFDVLQIRCSRAEALSFVDRLDVIHQHHQSLAKEAQAGAQDEDE